MQKNKTILMLSVVCAALVVVLTVMTIMLVGKEDEKGLSEAEVRLIAENAVKESNSQHTTANEDIIEDKPAGCTCAEGTLELYIPYDVGCTHTVLCDECRLIRGEESCDIVDGVCIACGSVPVHTYKVVESSMYDNGEMVHTMKCILCDDRWTEQCDFSTGKNCSAEGCTNECPHNERTLSGEMTEGEHKETCNTCGEEVNAATPAPGEECPTAT